MKAVLGAMLLAVVVSIFFFSYGASFKPDYWFLVKFQANSEHIRDKSLVVDIPVSASLSGYAISNEEHFRHRLLLLGDSGAIELKPRTKSGILKIGLKSGVKGYSKDALKELSVEYDLNGCPQIDQKKNEIKWNNSLESDWRSHIETSLVDFKKKVNLSPLIAEECELDKKGLDVITLAWANGLSAQNNVEVFFVDAYVLSGNKLLTKDKLLSWAVLSVEDSYFPVSISKSNAGLISGFSHLLPVKSELVISATGYRAWQL